MLLVRRASTLPLALTPPSLGSLLSVTLVGPRAPRSIVVFGAGAQISAHLHLHLSALPSITTCTIINRNLNPRTAALLARLQPRFPRVSFTCLASTATDTNPDPLTRIKHALLSTPLIICATSSTAPLFPAAWVRAGAHVILVGSYTPAMHEVDAELVRRALPAAGPSGLETPGPGPPARPLPTLLVDSRVACAVEAGELIDAGVGGEQVTEIGELVRGAPESVQLHAGEDGKEDTEEPDYTGPITMFKSVGVGLQDVAIAVAVVQRAEEMGVGVRVQGYDA